MIATLWWTRASAAGSCQRSARRWSLSTSWPGRSILRQRIMSVILHPPRPRVATPKKPGLALRGSERVPVTIRGHKRRSPAPAMPLVGSTSSAASDYGRAQQSTAAAETRLGDGRLWCSENKRTARIEPHTALIYPVEKFSADTLSSRCWLPSQRSRSSRCGDRGFESISLQRRVTRTRAKRQIS